MRSNGQGFVWLAMFLLKVYFLKGVLGKHPLRLVLVVL